MGTYPAIGCLQGEIGWFPLRKKVAGKLHVPLNGSVQQVPELPRDWVFKVIRSGRLFSAGSRGFILPGIFLKASLENDVLSFSQLGLENKNIPKSLDEYKSFCWVMG